MSEPSEKAAKAITLEDDKAHDAVNDFGENLEDGFGNIDGGDFGADFGMLDLNLDIHKPPTPPPAPASAAPEVSSGKCMFACLYARE